MKYGNATKAVYDIYNVKKRNSAAAIGCRLLRNVNVRKEIDRIFETEESIPVSIAALIKQMLEHGNWKERIFALKMAMKIHGYY